MREDNMHKIHNSHRTKIRTNGSVCVCARAMTLSGVQI